MILSTMYKYAVEDLTFKDIVRLNKPCNLWIHYINSISNIISYIMERKDLSLKQELIKQFQAKLHKRRSSFDWCKKVNAFFLHNVDHDTMKGIQSILFRGSKIHGYVVRSIARLLFGEKRLTEAKLFNGSNSFAVKSNQRPKLFSRQDEKDLKDILGLIDEDLFSTNEGWQILVVAPVNQLGLDIKRDSKKKDKAKGKNKKESSSEINNEDPKPSTSNIDPPPNSDDEDLTIYELSTDSDE